MRFVGCTRAVAAFLAVTMFAAVAAAQEPGLPCPELRAAARNVPEPLRLDSGGISGMWFPMPTARLILCETQSLPNIVRDLRLANESIQLYQQRIDLFEERLTLSDTVSARLEGAMDAAEREADRATSRLDHWTRSPYLWLSAGFVLAIGFVSAGATISARLSR